MKKVFIKLILSVQNREKDLYQKKKVQNPCSCPCRKGLLCNYVQFFLEILTISVMICYKCGASIFVTCRSCAKTEPFFISLR